MSNKSLGDYPIMKELKDEDKWFKYFTMKQLLAYGIAASVGIALTVLLYKVGLEIIGIVFLIFNIAIVAIMQIKIPYDKYLIGGGFRVFNIFQRLILKYRNRVIYTRNVNEQYMYGQEEDK